MLKNYFFLNRFILEANEALKGFKILSVFSQEKDTLLLEFSNYKDEKYLEISVNPGFPYLNLKESFHRAKKNSIDFYQNFLPSAFTGFEISDKDRIIKIKFEKVNLYFAVRGKYTNIHLIDGESKFHSFKKTDAETEHQFLNEINNTNFIDFFNIPEPEMSGESDLEIIRKKYPVIGKEIYQEALSRYNSESAPDKLYKKIIKEIYIQKPAIFYDENNHQLNLAVDTFSIFSFIQKTTYNSLVEAINIFIGRKYLISDLEKKHKLIDKFLAKEIAAISSKINKLKGRIDKGSKEEEYKKFGNLLLINLSDLRKGDKEIEVDDIYNNNLPVKIKLNETLPPRKNADYYFEKSRSEKINYEKSKELYRKFSEEFNKFREYQHQLKFAETREDYEVLIKELKLKKEEPASITDELKNKFKQYLIENKYRIYVGRDSKNNDLLTTKFAKQNDYWFHARSVSGSHVVLRVENTKEIIPKNILKKAASLAAYHSKAKTSGLAPVSYSLKKYVVKKKGMEPGKVALLKEDVLIVKPEIPEGCEFLTID